MERLQPWNTVFGSVLRVGGRPLLDLSLVPRLWPRLDDLLRLLRAYYCLLSALRFDI